MINSHGLAFEKIEACGNDFVLLESHLDGARIARICDRHHGLGADGVMVHEPGADPVRLAHYDPDGSRSFCLNGVRSSLACLYKKNRVPQAGVVESEGVTMAYAMEDGLAAIQLEKTTYQPRVWRGEGVTLEGFWADVGNPHFITVNQPDLETFHKLAPRIRADLAAFPQGVNVNLALRHGSQWRIHTFERGVEGFTLACGSGMLATALVLLGENLTDEVTFIPEGQGQVTVKDMGPTLMFRGDANWVASGVWLC